jgi:hypothetical protein
MGTTRMMIIMMIIMVIGTFGCVLEFLTLFQVVVDDI